MSLREPGSMQVAVRLGALMIALGMCSNAAMASQTGDFGLFKNTVTEIFGIHAGSHTHSQINYSTLLDKAEKALAGNVNFQPLFDDGAVQFNAGKAVTDDYSTTIRFAQTYKGLDVVGDEAMVHFDSTGAVHDVTGQSLNIVLSTEPAVSLDQARQLLSDHVGQSVRLSETAKLKIFRDFGGKAHLVYHMLTRSTAAYDGQEIFLDAQTGSVVLEFERAMDAVKGARTVYSANTEKALSHVDERGYPTDIDLSWYDKVVEDGDRTEAADRSALNAYRSAGQVYGYYKNTFNRDSFDNKGARIVSVVHMGKKMNNAFWTNEYKIMAYGDGDGEHLTDLTAGLDVTAHELTHGVSASTANLVYSAESGALNESYSDVFGKMVDYNGDWDIGAKIMAPKWGRRALRNMETPEEFKQPATKGGKFWVSTEQTCNRANDRCGVHTNSGVPSRAAVMIVKAIGKEKAEALYYKVLTTRLSATSNFRTARAETEKECALAFGGSGSSECLAVASAFDAVKM